MLYLIIIFCLLLAWFIYIYNKLISLKNLTQNAWSDIDVFLKKRHELIPNLVASVKGYMQHEENVLEQITEARNKAMASHSVSEQITHEEDISQMVRPVMVAVENYPDLKANENFMKLHDELYAVEKNIANARRYFNAVVRDYNTAQEVFPNFIVAKMFGHRLSDFFEANQNERLNVKVDLDE